MRLRQQRNFLATLFLSQGVPMLLAGDEMGRTQGGNNNAYCQDNEISWLDWNLPEENAALLEFVRELMAFRYDHPVLRRRKWFQGRSIHGSGIHDIVWFNPDGVEMTEEQWHDGLAKVIGIFLNGEEIATPNRHGERIIADSFMLLFHAHYEPVEFSLPAALLQHAPWRTVMDSAQPRFLQRGRCYSAEAPTVPVAGRALVVLQRSSGT